MLRRRVRGVACPLLLPKGIICVTVYFEPLLTKFVVRVHIVIKENTSLQLLREGGLKSLELKGDMNLQVSEPEFTKIKLALVSLSSDFSSSELQFKQHPNVAKFGASGDRIVALKDPSRSFPVNQSLAVLKWRYTGKDESHVPLSSK